jgi:hypothetical protein
VVIVGVGVVGRAVVGCGPADRVLVGRCFGRDEVGATGIAVADGYAGRSDRVGAGAGVLRSAVGLLAARLIPTTSAAQPTTASEAAQDATNRPQRM